jgi:hypothetical protein
VVETQWSNKRHGSSIVISNDGRSAANPAQSYEVAMGENFYTEGTHVYRVRVDACIYLGIGRGYFGGVLIKKVWWILHWSIIMQSFIWPKGVTCIIGGSIGRLWELMVTVVRGIRMVPGMEI